MLNVFKIEQNTLYFLWIGSTGGKLPIGTPQAIVRTIPPLIDGLVDLQKHFLAEIHNNPQIIDSCVEGLQRTMHSDQSCSIDNVHSKFLKDDGSDIRRADDWFKFQFVTNLIPLLFPNRNFLKVTELNDLIDKKKKKLEDVILEMAKYVTNKRKMKISNILSGNK